MAHKTVTRYLAILIITTPWEGTSAAYSIGDFAEVGVLPEVADFVRAFDADVAPFGGDLGGGVAAVEEADGVAAIGQRLGPDFDGAFLGDADALFAELVLIDGDDFFVHEDVGDRRLHVADVVAGEQGRGQQAPEAHVGLVFGVGHAAVADFQHVGVVPVAGAGVLLAAGLEFEADVLHGVPSGR